MEKYGTSNKDLLESLRKEEADLMIQMQYVLMDGTKTASDKTNLENRLISVRNKITELDLN